MRYAKCEQLIRESYEIFDNLIIPILTMIKLDGYTNFKINNASTHRPEIHSPGMKDFIDDCKYLTEHYPVNKDIIKFEKMYFDMIFDHYKQIHSIWKINDLTNYHMMPYIALLTGDVDIYTDLICQYIKEYFERYPVDYEYSIVPGSDIIQIRNLNYEDRRNLNPLDSGNYTIKITKWYILRKYYRQLPYRENEDLGYTENVFECGIATKKEALELLEQVKGKEFQPYYKCSTSAYLSYLHFKLFGNN